MGTIESRMQTADVIILTGLNEGMFPGLGYENAWLPRDIAKNRFAVPKSQGCIDGTGFYEFIMWENGLLVAQ